MLRMTRVKREKRNANRSYEVTNPFGTYNVLRKVPNVIVYIIYTSAGTVRPTHEGAAFAGRVHIINQAREFREWFSKGRLRKTCCISQYSLGVNFTDSDAGIYTKGVRDVRAFCVAGESRRATSTIFVFAKSYFVDNLAVDNAGCA